MIVNPILLIIDLLMQHTFQDITMTNKNKKNTIKYYQLTTTYVALTMSLPPVLKCMLQ